MKAYSTNSYKKALDKFLDKFNFDVDIRCKRPHVYYDEVVIRFLHRENKEPVMFKMIDGYGTGDVKELKIIMDENTDIYKKLLHNLQFVSLNGTVFNYTEEPTKFMIYLDMIKN